MEMNRILPLIFALIITSALSAQVAENRYIVYFSDKENTTFTTDEPAEYLSQKAIDRRFNQGIAIDLRDLPVDPAYVQAVLDLGDVSVQAHLKWMNAILIETTDPAVIDGIENLVFVEALEGSPVITGDDDLEAEMQEVFTPKSDEDYGLALNQIQMLNGLQLHADGFRGEGMWVAVFDAGFINLPNAAVMSSLYNSDRIIGTYDFVNNTTEVYGLSTHGSQVLSTMAADMEGVMIGTAPDASYLLCITEDVSMERRIEEALWVAAAAYADSIGIDIINTSLGYTEFDEESESYTYADMDGNTALITRGADIAASRGMLVVNSAGNQGANEWQYISAPADGDSVLAVGAVNAEASVVAFSSRGPSADGRVKPNVMAQGAATILSDLADGVSAGNGTSFSGPVLTGMATSLWSAFPDATAWEVFQAIEQSAHLYEMPNDSMGYGIPDFEVARDILGQVVNTQTPEVSKLNLRLFPNPYTGGSLQIALPEAHGKPVRVRLIDITGRVVYHQEFQAGTLFEDQGLNAALQRSGKGLYFVEIQTDAGHQLTGKLIRQ